MRAQIHDALLDHGERGGLHGLDGKPSVVRSARSYMGSAGYLLLMAAAGLLAFLAYRASATLAPLPLEPDQIPLVWVMQWYGYDLLILIGAIAAGVIGIRLLGAAGKGTPTVIPPEDRELLTELIKGEKKAAINLYVVLSSLSGFTGTFQKIGFSGLPLATVTLTLIFSGLSFFQAEFLELAKLTLGAFIGSFVQKGRDAPKLPDA